MKYSNRKQLILEGRMTNTILILATPIMFNNFIQTLYNLADTYWVSKLGSMEIAAMTLVFPIIFLILSLGMGMNVAGTALISQYVGSNQQNDANVVAGQLFSFSFIVSILLSSIGFLSTDWIIHAIGGEGEIFIHSSQYLRIMFLEMPGIFLFFVYNAIKQGQGDTFTPMILNVCGVILNIILDPIFIFQFNLGIRGAAIATVFSRSIFALLAVYTLFYGKGDILLNRNTLKFQPNMLMKIIKIGLPASIGQSAAAFGFIVLNIFVISYGPHTLAAFGIGNRINSLVLMPVMGIGSALATIIGQNLGADRIDRARLAFKTSMGLSSLFMVLGGTLLFYFSRSIVSIFTSDLVVIAEGTYYLRLISASPPLMGMFQVFVGTFQGSGHTVYAMLMDMGRLWGLRIPMILLFKEFTNWGSASVWYAMVLSNGLVCVLGLIIYLKGAWEIQVIQKKSVDAT